MNECMVCGHTWEYDTPAGRCPKEAEHSPFTVTRKRYLVVLELTADFSDVDYQGQEWDIPNSLGGVLVDGIMEDIPYEHPEDGDLIQKMQHVEIIGVKELAQ